MLRKLTLLARVVVLAALAGSIASAQSLSGADPARALVSALLRANGIEIDSAAKLAADGAHSTREFLLGIGMARRSGLDGEEPVQGNGIFVLRQTVRNTSAPKSRSLSLVGPNLLAVALRADGTAVQLAVLRDPRVGIAEAIGEDKRSVYGSAVVETPDPFLTVAVPDDATISEIRLFEPQWSGNTLVALRLVGSIGLGSR